MANFASFGTAPTQGAKTAPAKKKVAPKTKDIKAPSSGTSVPPATVKRYSGSYSGALNNLSDQEQRAHDVGRRRQADAKAYSAYVMGQQGAIGAAAQQQDAKATMTQMGIQQMGAKAGLALQGTLQQQRTAQGISGAVPAQQLVAPVDQQQRNNAVLTAIAGRTADQANTNKGKAGFLAAAAQAGLMANQRAIAGQEFEQVSQIQGQKTGILTAKTEGAMADRRAREAAEAASANAAMQANESAADRASRENIAMAGLELDNAKLQDSRYQKSRDRSVRLRTAEVFGGPDGTNIKPANLKTARNELTGLDNGMALAHSLLSSKAPEAKALLRDPNALRSTIRSKYPDISKPAIELIISKAYGREPGKGAKGTADKRWKAYLAKVKQGRA